MSALERILRIAAEIPNAAAPDWRRFRDAGIGLSFEVPFEIVDEPGQGPFGRIAEGRMTLPFVFDVTYMAAREISDDSPEVLTREMAVQWTVDYDLAAAPALRRVEYPGVEEAWCLSAEIRDDAGTLDHSWVTLRKDGRIGCLGVSCWSVECPGREARLRTLGSVLGD